LKVIYHSFAEHKSAIISSLYKKYNWNPVCVAGAHIDDDGTIGGVSLKNCIISNPFKLRRAEFNYDEVSPPRPIDAAILEKLAPYESSFLDLLGTFQDKTGWEFSYSERKSFYFDILTYWNTVINECSPNLVVFYTWPHTPSCYPLYLLSKHYYNIDILFIDPAPLLGESYHIISNSIENTSSFFNDANIDASLISAINLNEPSISVSDMANDNSEPEHIVGEYDVFKYSKSYSTIIYQYLKGKVNIKNILKFNVHFKNLNYDRKASKLPYYKSKSRMNLFQKIVFFEKLKYRNRKLKKYYHLNIASPDLNVPYIYFSAPYQPEATSYLGGGYYENVILALKVLSYTCPKDWVIYYKEHPSSFFDNLRGSLKRNKRFYEQINELQNIEMVSSDFNQFTLIKKSKATAVVCGTTAWQSVVRGKPVISFGQSWYSGCKGIMQVSSLQDSKDALKLILSGFSPQKEDLDQYIAIIKKTGFKFKEHYNPPKIVFDENRSEEIADEFYKAFLRIQSE